MLGWELKKRYVHSDGLLVLNWKIFAIADAKLTIHKYFSVVSTVFFINRRVDLHEAMTLITTFEETKYDDMQKGLNLAKQK